MAIFDCEWHSLTENVSTTYFWRQQDQTKNASAFHLFRYLFAIKSANDTW